jgi:hypothetical protein
MEATIRGKGATMTGQVNLPKENNIPQNEFSVSISTLIE